VDVQDVRAEARQFGGDAFFGRTRMNGFEADADRLQYTRNFRVVGPDQRDLVPVLLKHDFLGMHHHVFPAGKPVSIVDEEDSHRLVLLQHN